MLESPPNEIILQHIIVFKGKLMFNCDVIKEPFVISKKPKIYDEVIFGFIPIFSKMYIMG